jgi:hypothetical protein
LVENAHARLSDLYWHDERCVPWQGTGLGVVQAVNVFENWDSQIRRVAGRSVDVVRAERQFGQMLDGQKLTARAMSLVGAA